MNFAEYIQRFSKEYKPGTSEYDMRRSIFENRVAEVTSHNSHSDELWQAGVNPLTDYTDAELARLRGYRRYSHIEKPAPVGFLSKGVQLKSLSHLPDDFTWKHRLAATREVQDQGACGSCWAISSATVLRAHSELYQSDRQFSTQRIVSCTPNPRHCGGDGGCDGATAELAMEYVSKNGCPTEGEEPYLGASIMCPTTLAQSPTAGAGAAFGMDGYKKLPENKLEPILLALYEQGPLVVSLAAGATWNLYSSGIMSACSQDAIIDHAVTLVGFGKEKTRNINYWQLQNSWGPDWGEAGFVRLLRHDHRNESAYCGWDKKPQIGSGCDGGPEKVRICGSCGILYDAVIPTFRQGAGGLMARLLRESKGVF